MTPLKIAFDIGGWISRYPAQSLAMAEALMTGGCSVVILTDMPAGKALRLLAMNGWGVGTHFDGIIAGDFTEFRENCKAVAMERESIDVLFDDYPPYLIGSGYVGLMVWPKEDAPWQSEDWITESAEGGTGL